METDQSHGEEVQTLLSHWSKRGMSIAVIDYSRVGVAQQGSIGSCNGYGTMEGCERLLVELSKLSLRSCQLRDSGKGRNFTGKELVFLWF